MAAELPHEETDLHGACEELGKELKPTLRHWKTQTVQKQVAIAYGSWLPQTDIRPLQTALGLEIPLLGAWLQDN